MLKKWCGKFTTVSAGLYSTIRSLLVGQTMWKVGAFLLNFLPTDELAKLHGSSRVDRGLKDRIWRRN